MDLDNLLKEIYNDISFSNEDVENIKENTNRHISEELEKINTYLQKSVLEFTKQEIENLKKSKIDRFNKNINTITENTLTHVAKEFNLDKDEVLEKNKDNLLQINNFHTLYEQDLSIIKDITEDSTTLNTIAQKEPCTESTTNTTNTTNSIVNDNKVVKDKSTKTKKKKAITLDETTENDNYKNHLISQHKCPAFIKGKYCSRPHKTGCGNYCGFHKKFNV